MAEKRRYKKSEITRRRLIEAAIEVFAEKGYSKARITDITKRVGLTHAAFYAYFKDKDDLVRSLVEEVSGTFNAGKDGRKEGQSIDFKDQKALKKYILGLFSTYAENLPLHAAFIEGALQDEGLRELLGRLNRELSSNIAARVREGKREGRCAGWSPDAVGGILVTAIGYLAVTSEMGVIPYSSEIVADNLAKILSAAFS